jgi:DNA repair photolyase
MASVLPGISSKPSQLREVVRAAKEAGACAIWTNLLFLRPGTLEHFLTALAEDFPEQLSSYERLYASRAYLGKEQTKPVREQVAELAREYGIRDGRHVRLEPDPPVLAEQLALAV